MRRLVVLIAALIAVVSACGESEPLTATSDSSPLDDVTVVEGDEGEEPTLEFDQPFELDESARRVLEEGDGEEVVDGTVVKVQFLIVNGTDGSTIQSSFGEDPAVFAVEPSLVQGIYDGLIGLPIGSSVLVGIAPADGFGPDPSTGEESTDTVLFYAEILDEAPQRAEGTAVEPVEGLPTVELAEDGAPTITVPEGEPPAELVAQPLIEGDGPAVELGQSITVHYTGVVWATGEQFDSSWERGTPFTTGIGEGSVIVGWDEGLVGKTVGSQILLVIPPEKGYPEGQGSIPAGATLVFVVDILDAT